MNGLMSKYKKSLLNTPKPVVPSELAKIKIDLKGLLAYAKEKKISPAELSDKEKARFIVQ